ncbi:TIGR01777 family oxidoreductase [Enterobacterales bacterium AE_CKDN230030158-1A_HGKHYDSX7]
MTELSLLDWALTLLIVQALLGALDVLYHHELTVALPYRRGARLELSIHAVRACIYGVLFLGIAHLGFHGAWALAVASLFTLEIVLTLWDFTVEDRTRKLPPLERVMHTLLAINGGAFLALYGLQLLQWGEQPTALTAIESGWRSWVLTLAALGVTASGIRDALAALKLTRRASPENPFLGIAPRRVLVTGGTGFIGELLVNQLLDTGHQVTLLARDPVKAAYQFAGRARCVSSLKQLGPFDLFDVVINLAGAPVAGPRWTARRQEQLLASRVGVTQALLDWMSQTPQKPALWIQASAIGFYGVRAPEEHLDEDALPGTGFMTELCARWEASAQPVRDQGIRQVVLRLGVVFGPGGPLVPLLLPFRLGVGGRIGNGRQVLSWIHIDDVLRVFARCLADEQLQGTYNLVAPEAVSQAEFAERAGRQLKRPVWLHIPDKPVRRLAGEMAELFLDGQRVVPRRLSEAGFAFRFATLDAALRDLS